MSSLSDLARQHTSLRSEERGHLWRLIGSWGLLADLSFADLLLVVPVAARNDVAPEVQSRSVPDRSGTEQDRSTPRDTSGPGTGLNGRQDPFETAQIERFVTVGQIRPATAQTLYRDDQVGRFYSAHERPLAKQAFETGEICSGEVELRSIGRRAAVQAIPVRCNGRVIAVLSAETPGLGSREKGELERTYLSIFDNIVRMIADGIFPFDSEDVDSEESPRVGDGVLVSNAAGRITYTSPNAVSALHRIGFHANAVGRDLDDLGFQPGLLRTAFTLRVAVTEEIERGLSISILSKVIPLIRDGEIVGALVLLRDVSDLRRQQRLLVSMDATIREIHHRVKNNLQTVSSLLRLQGRRVEHPEARAAIDESVRRIRSIALVHEILAQEGGDEVAFAEIMRPIVQMVQEALVAPDRPINFKVVGDGPTLPASTASSLAVVLTELLQNAVEHGYPPGSSGGEIVIELEFSGSSLRVRIHDDGAGLPDGFDLATSPGLGLTIARTLASGELGGQISMRQIDPDDASAGTIAELRASFGAP